MRLAALLVLLSVPLLEIGVLVKVGQWLGLWWTLGLVLATAILGSAVIANQGFNAPFRMQEAIRRGETPIATMFDGALIWTAGFLLLTPGFIADFLGLVLLIPPARRLLARWAAKQFFGMADFDVEIRTSRTTQAGGRPRPGETAGQRDGRAAGQEPEDGPVIEGEFRRLEERTMDKDSRRSGNSSGS